MTITIEPEVKELLKVQADAMGLNMSAYISELVLREDFFKILRDEKDKMLAEKVARIKAMKKETKRTIIPTHKGDALAAFELEDDFKDSVSQAVSKRAKVEKGKELMKKAEEEAKVAEAQADQANDGPGVDTVDEPAEEPDEEYIPHPEYMPKPQQKEKTEKNEQTENDPTPEDVSDVIKNSGKSKRRRPIKMI
ncbi:hypothetical protein [Selenomonas ruminantium]|nr:hypothetical protein [Selenomonas ruminantium]